MHYTIRRISIGSAIKIGLMLGWLVALCPALCMAGIGVQLLQRASQVFAQVAPFDITILGQSVAHIDLLQQVGLSDTAQLVSQFSANVGRSFILLALLFVIAGAVVFLGVALLFSVGYNVLARLAGGLEIELREASRR